MSDVKKAILDEIAKKIAAVGEADSTMLAYPLTAQVNYRSGLIAAEQIVIDALEGMSIVPVEANSAMIGAGEFADSHDGAYEDIYAAMLESFKEQDNA